MLAVARALTRKPRLLLVDELSLGLAPLIVQGLLPIIREYADESGCGVLLVEQHVHLALATADHAYVLSHGEVVLHETADALRGNHELLMASYFGEGSPVPTPDTQPSPVPPPPVTLSGATPDMDPDRANDQSP
jgi:branched-chain amino acid transport system ATP-binding protein